MKAMRKKFEVGEGIIRNSTRQSNTRTKPKPRNRNRNRNSNEKVEYDEGRRNGGGRREEASVRREKSMIEIEREVLKNIVGQDKQVRQIITAIYRARNFRSIKSNVLVIGKSGTGKTETVKQIAKRLDIPYTIEDATKYTKAGYVGSDVTEMIYNLIEAANGDYVKAQYGLIFIDEIDKKAGGGIQNDVSGVEVLKSLLKIIEDATFPYPLPPRTNEELFNPKIVQVSTKNIIVMFSGAFSGIEKIVEKRLNTRSIGFDTSKDAGKKADSEKITKKDLIEFGMPEEFVGRIDTIVQMNDLNEADLAKILMNSDLSIFMRYRSELARKGVTLVYTNDIFAKIAKASLQTDTGARELSNTVNRMFEQIVYEILANPYKYSMCELDPEIVDNNSKFTLY